ncbi:MAG: DUF1273 family protein [Clostridia bacterium]|nr:DUF1273 family protein [Clostridia bacterium]
MKNKKLCAIFGENPSELEFGYDEEYYTCAVMKFRLVSAMQDALADGCREFISTLDEGAAMWGAEACLAIKSLGGDVTLTVAPTSERQAERWHPERRERYFNLIEKADELISPVGDEYGEDYILKSVGRVIVVGNTSHPRIAEFIENARAEQIEICVV